eukprot:2121474-Rhodomonas_salina.4
MSAAARRELYAAFISLFSPRPSARRWAAMCSVPAELSRARLQEWLVCCGGREDGFHGRSTADGAGGGAGACGGAGAHGHRRWVEEAAAGSDCCRCSHRHALSVADMAMGAPRRLRRTG